MLSSLFAIAWENEIRGILTVLIAVVALCGTVYLILGTNLGTRLGFLVALAGLAGWMATMGLIWWIYGIGLKGIEPTWKLSSPIVLDGNLKTIGILDAAPPSVNDPDDANGDALDADGWDLLTLEDKSRGQAIASATEILNANKIDAAKLVPGNVYIKGGERYPKFEVKLGKHKADVDFIAFLHKPKYAIVELQALAPTVNEAGRAPASPKADPSKPKEYVIMVRDQGTKRQPAVMLTFGGGLIFLLLCWMLHRRDRTVARHTGTSLERVPAGA